MAARARSDRWNKSAKVWRMDAVALFTCGGETITREHLLVAADANGNLAALRAESRERLACLEHAYAVSHSVDDALLQERSEDFRRARGLRSGQATQAWMENHGVTLDDFGGYLEREACRQHFQHDMEKIVASVPVGDNELDTVLWPDIIFSGACEAWCRQLAGELAVFVAQGDGRSLTIDLAVWRDTFSACVQCYKGYCAKILTTDRLDQALRQSWQDYFTFQCDIAQFQSDAAAREACLCVREDGESLASVCATAHGHFARQRLTLRQLPADVQMFALSAVPGTLLPPVEDNGHHLVYAVVEKHEPDLHDDATRAILSETLLAESIRPLVQSHIQWADAFT